MPEDRRLAAIMFTDIVGYTALMGSDEDKAFKVLRKNREIQRPIIKKYRGEWLKEMGDGILASFHSASDAVRCASEIQQATKKEGIALRIGIHEGEVVFEGGDVLGDGVNIASRLEEMADEGCIYVSGAVYKDIKNKVGITAKFIDEKELKNVDEPVKVYQVKCAISVAKQAEDNSSKTRKSNIPYYILAGVIVVLIVIIIRQIQPTKVPTPIVENTETVIDKSIAVLPFNNLSPEENSQYLADGVMDAITNHLAKIRELRVIARTSTEVYRGRPKDVREMGKELSVNYLLEGSFQKYGNDARLIVQLINSNDGSHIWSNEYDREWADIFTVQSEVAQAIANEIKIILTPEAKQSIETIPTTNLTAYEYYLRGEEYIKRGFSFNDYRYGIQMYERAIKLDSNFTLAWVGIAASSRFIYWFYYDRSDDHLRRTKQYLDKAIELEPKLVEVKLEEAKYYYQINRSYKKALQILDKLKSRYPMNAEIHFWMGVVYKRMGKFSKAINYCNRAIELNPNYWLYWNDLATLNKFIGHYNEAEECFKKIIDLNPSNLNSYWFLINLHYLKGDLHELKKLLNDSDIPLDSQTVKIQIELLNGNYKSVIEIEESSPFYVINGITFFFSKHLTLGLLNYLIANEKMANIYFEKERIFLEEQLRDKTNDDRIYRSLGIVYAALGKKSKAIDYGNKSIEILGLSDDAFSGEESELTMVRILLMVGEYDEAITKLKYLLNYSGNISTEYLRNHYYWKPFHDIEKFKQLLQNPN